MPKKLRTALTTLCLALFLTGGAMILLQYMDYSAAADSYDAAQDALATAPPVTIPHEEEPPRTEVPEVEEPAIPPVSDEATALLKGTDFASLYAVNEDVEGWIAIPGTELNYPLMQGTDNDYYLNNTWDGVPSAAGSIFVEHQQKSDLSEFNTLIYGHRMKNGSMFATLKYYDSADYLAAHPYIYIAKEEGVYRYEVFAAFEAGVTTNTYRLAFPDEAARQDFIDLSLSQTVIDSGVEVTPDDQFITLVTCTGRGYASRWVVQARLEGFDPAA